MKLSDNFNPQVSVWSRKQRLQEAEGGGGHPGLVQPGSQGREEVTWKYNLIKDHVAAQ